jgi:predicted DNA-binding transcriptional regulator AlpA
MVSADMAQQVDLDNRDQVMAVLEANVITAEAVAELTGLAVKSIYVYHGRDRVEFPEPMPFSTQRCLFWWRPDILDWIETRRA